MLLTPPLNISPCADWSATVRICAFVLKTVSPLTRTSNAIDAPFLEISSEDRVDVLGPYCFRQVCVPIFTIRGFGYACAPGVNKLRDICTVVSTEFRT